MTLLRVHGATALITVVVWAAALIMLGPAAFVLLVVLCLLEITFSFDNAVVNAKLVGRLSPFWERLFMTVGMFIAVGVVRFVLPVAIVALVASLSFTVVLDLVWNQPDIYARHLADAGPLIEAFGGTFLIMITIGFFLDDSKEHHWLRGIEKRLAPLGRYDNTGILAMLAGALVLFFTLDKPAPLRAAIFAAAIAGIGLHMLLDLLGAMMDNSDAARTVQKLTGAAAFVMFMRLEVLDASFSFDGVIGAFAITSNVILIAAGLGIGALWVRSLTVHLVRAGTLARYQYLEHGAHWAIGALGIIMIAKLYGVHPPEVVTGSIGLVFIFAAVMSSIRETRRAAVA